MGTSYYVEKMGFQSLMNTGHMFASEIGNDYAGNNLAGR